jgi:hypothetical protein
MLVDKHWHHNNLNYKLAQVRNLRTSDYYLHTLVIRSYMVLVLVLEEELVLVWAHLMLPLLVSEQLPNESSETKPRSRLLQPT